VLQLVAWSFGCCFGFLHSSLVLLAGGAFLHLSSCSVSLSCFLLAFSLSLSLCELGYPYFVYAHTTAGCLSCVQHKDISIRFSCWIWLAAVKEKKDSRCSYRVSLASRTSCKYSFRIKLQAFLRKVFVIIPMIAIPWCDLFTLGC
jgi:hypothetical protein